MELTPASLKKLCRDLKLYSSAPELNDVLHLQHKGITKLENLEAYTGLKTLYLECNAIADIEGLDALVNLRCLYLGKNMIHQITGLNSLTQLETLDLSENDIRHVEGLQQLTKLKFLSLSGNKLEQSEDIVHLEHCQSLVTLDLSSNRISDEGAVQMITKLPLSLLKLNGNPVVTAMRSYRKNVIAGMLGLHHLDDMPVTLKERRLAIAFLQGGLQAERAERTLVMQEEEQHKEQQRQNFNNMVEAARAEAAQNPPPPHDPMRFRAMPPGESDSDDDAGDKSHRSHQDASASIEQRLSSADHVEDDTLTGGSTSTAQLFTDADAPAEDSEQQDESQLQGSGSHKNQPQSQGQSHSQAQTQEQPQSQGQFPVQPQAQSQAQSHGQRQSQLQSKAQDQMQSAHPAVHMTGVQSPFLDRLAIADGACTPQEFKATQHTQHAQHAGQHSRHSNAHPQEASQPAAGHACPGPDQATGSDFKPSQATESSAQEARGNQLLTGGLDNEEEGHAHHQSSAADPVAGGQTLASNLAFQQELQQRSSEMHARADDMGRGQQRAEGEAPLGQEGGQRNQREPARAAVWGTPQYGDLWQQALSLGERQEAAQADNPQPDDLIQSAMYSGDADTDSRQSDHMGRGRPQHALSEGRGHQAMDIDSAAAHRIPRGDDSAAESDASSLSDYDATSDPMQRFTITALPRTDPQVSQQTPASAWYEHQHQSQVQLPVQLPRQSWHHQSQQQLPMQLPFASDDSAHNPRHVGVRLGSGLRDEEEAEVLSLRPDLAALRGRDDSARDMPGSSTARPDLHRSSGPFERTDSASDLPVTAATGHSPEHSSPLAEGPIARISPTDVNSDRRRRDSAVESLTLARQAMNNSAAANHPSILGRASASSTADVGASPNRGIASDMLEEPQRQDSALHPLIEARRAVLQDLAENPDRPQPSVASGSLPSSSGIDHDLTGRVDSAIDTLSAARAAVRTSPRGFSTNPSSSSQLPEQASSSSCPAVSAEASATWQPSGFRGLSSEISSASAYGPPLIENPSQTLEEARRLVALSLYDQPSSSDSFSHAGPSGSGLVRSTSRTLEEARRLVMSAQNDRADLGIAPGARHEGAGQAGQGPHGDMGFSLQRDSAQHPLVEARRQVLEDLARYPSKASEHAASSSGADASIRRQHSLHRDSPLQPILLARQAMQEPSQQASGGVVQF